MKVVLPHQRSSGGAQGFQSSGLGEFDDSSYPYGYDESRASGQPKGGPMVDKGSARPRRIPVVIGGVVAAGIAGLVTYPLPQPWALWLWFAMTVVIGAALGFAGDRPDRR